MLTLMYIFVINNLYFVLLWDKCAQKLNGAKPTARQNGQTVLLIIKEKER